MITWPAAAIEGVGDGNLEPGHVPRPFLGVAMQAVPVPEALRAQFAEGADQVLLVLHVEPNAPAASAGVLVGDLIVSLNRGPVHDVCHAPHRVSRFNGGESLSPFLVRGGAGNGVN